ncbi:Protein Hook-like 3 [Fragariocoptes setiger]|uniref:Protein hook n=1 Tax=Fragariocoptes setiger TaxID=1670756 RepID=A0ABQ7SD03_9ACAR|nr:Protein Hook-like 3 [Fragariocoptes setiger]
MSLFSSLIQWLSTFDNDTINASDITSPKDLSDGVLCAKILNQIAPQFFDEEWMRRIIPAPPHFNWRLRVSNLKKVVQKIRDYTNDILSQQFALELVLPDINLIAQEFDTEQISRLIQLILCCAVNCDKKQDYIQRILDLPVQVQHDVMTAIQELIPGDRSALSYDKTDSSDAQINNSTPKSESRYGSSSHLSTPTSTRLDTSRTSHQLNASNLSAAPSNVKFNSPMNASQHEESSYFDDKQKILRDLELANKSREEKAQQCHELEQRLHHLQIERDQLLIDNERMMSERRNSVGLTYSKQDRRGSSGANHHDATVSNDAPDIEQKTAMISKLQNQVQSLSDQLFKVETEKEEFRLKANLLQEDLDDLIGKHQNLLKIADQTKMLRDELDEQKHLYEKVEKYEVKIESYNKKLTEAKREIKCHEEKICELIRRNVELEEEVSKLNTLNSQLDKYKKQIQELQIKSSQESHRADKVECELTRLEEKFSVLRNENEQLVKTTMQLQSVTGKRLSTSEAIVDSVNIDYPDVRKKDSNSTPLNSDDINGEFSLVGGHGSTSASSTSDMKVRMIRLEHENQLLHKKLEESAQKNNGVLDGLLEAANLRCTQLENENRQIKRQYLMMQSKMKDITVGTGPVLQSPSHTAGPSIDTDNHHFALYAKIEELQAALSRKDQELMDAEYRYKRNLNKAKKAFKALEPLQMPGGLNASFLQSSSSSTSSFSSSMDECNVLRQQLSERHNRVVELEREFAEFKKIKEMHERLIITAFYGLSSSRQRTAAERRLQESNMIGSGRSGGDSPHNSCISTIWTMDSEMSNDSAAATNPEVPSELEEELKAELAKTEEEIQTLRQVLAARLKHAQELKRKLGIGPWKELTSEVQNGLKTVQETTAYVTNNLYVYFPALTNLSRKLKAITFVRAQTPPIESNIDTEQEHSDLGSSIESQLSTNTTRYQKTSESVKLAAEKTTDIFGSLSSSISKKLGDVKNSTAFKSIEEKVGSAVGGFKSGSASNTDDNLTINNNSDK